MSRSTGLRITSMIAALAALMVTAAPALAGEASPSVTDESLSTTPELSLSAQGPVPAGQPLQFSGSSSYASSEQLYLTVFALPASHCPAGPAVPSGANRIMAKDEVDDFVSITDLSGNLKVSGQWYLCGYLTNSSSAILVSSSVPFTVTGSVKAHSKRRASRHKDGRRR